MIFALLLRNFKTYQGINYIALSNGSSFSALVGENGAGKSSVLEALNSFSTMPTGITTTTYLKALQSVNHSYALCF
ncbi:AAA family ATPase [Pseudomonas aeruginosa]|uniref:AAA family ATPase n=1 Tax=Pseudomonas aeruginosa TaxID=287 RepID=UPI000EB563FC|nr:AAA family ATPase [Pseudomonas aeruginosa]HEK1347596.1 AAA family ATPase [Pseudomonas aeruginosa]